MKDFRNLLVWEKSHELTLDIYRATGDFPREEQFGLISQIRRSCASIPANIAEGCGKQSDADFKRFIQIAMGSACELEYHLLLSKDLAFLKNNTFEDLTKRLIEIKKMLSGFIKKLK